MSVAPETKQQQQIPNVEIYFGLFFNFYLIA